MKTFSFFCFLVFLFFTGIWAIQTFEQVQVLVSEHTWIPRIEYAHVVAICALMWGWFTLALNKKLRK